MSREHVEAFERGIEAYKRRDVDAFLEALDPELELQGALQALLESDAKLYRGHEGVRRWVRDIAAAVATFVPVDAIRAVLAPRRA